MRYTLGVDIGTFESKGVLVDEHGRVLAQSSHPHQMLVPQAGWAEHRPDQDWWGDFVTITRAILAQSNVDPADIAAVACSAIGPCMLPLDGDGRPLMNGVLYGVDTRAHQEILDLTAEIGADVILSRCGNALTSQSVGPKILWLRRNHPDLWARTAKLVTATTYLTYRLTGAYVIDHYTAANFSPLYDISAQDWRLDMADICTRDQLPNILWSHDIAGHIHADAAAETGLAICTPVICGTIDAAAEAVSVGVTQTGDLMMMYGSTIFMILLADRAPADARLWGAPWVFQGQSAVMAGLATSGTLTHWFRDQFARELPREQAFATLTEEALASPLGARGLVCLPYFSGERTPLHDPNAKGAFFGFNLTHQRGDMYRAVLEGIAAATRHVTDTFAEVGLPITRTRAVGGGTKNLPWLQATSDFTGLDQVICSVSTGASYGDAFMAAMAVGIAQMSDIHQWNPAQAQITAQSVPVYAKQYPLFRRLYEQTKDIAAEL
jgi:xylulokinase